MDKDHHPSAEFVGLIGPAELTAFKCQLHDYGFFLSCWIKQRKQDKGIIVKNVSHLVGLVNRLTQTFHLQCRLLQLAVWEYRCDEINRATVEEILQILPVILRGLIEPPTEKTQNILVGALEWLNILNRDYPNQVVLAHSTSNELTVNDHLFWASLERQEISHVWWNWRRLTPSQEQSAVEVVSPSLQLNASQQRGLELLEEIYLLHRQNKSVSGISTKPVPLLAGPSGSGKTELVRYFAQKHKLPLLDLNAGTWLVSGSSSGRTTLRLIRKFINNHAEGIVYLDELDKFSATTDWMKSVQQECMALIDRRTASFEDWTRKEQLQLERFFIMGAGTWQSLYYEDSQILGFASADEMNLEDKLTSQKQIPDEILFRFPHVLELKGLSLGDFKKRITEVRGELNLPALSKEHLASLAHEAVKSRRQYRWLEKYLVQALREKALPQ